MSDDAPGWIRELRFSAEAAGTVRRVPNKRAPGVKLRNFGCPDELWDRFMAAVEYNHDKPASEVIRKLIEGYTKRAERKREAGQ